MQLGETYIPYGKSCCYYRTTLKFIDEQPLAGGFYIRHPSASARDHEIEDIIAKDKCCNKSDFCDLFYQLHPPGTCYGTSPYNLGSFWGDPHIRTLDATNYTFNGLGEYVLLSIDAPNVTFALQARTERAIKKDGNLSDATIFTAFAAKDHLNSSVHIELNTDKDDFTLYGNGIDLTPDLRKSLDELFEFTTSTLTIHGDKGFLRVAFLALEITLSIGVGAEMLSLDTIVPRTFQNKARGLLGNFDGKPNNDFEYPNGSVLRADASDAEIFLFGQSWAVNDDTSVFIYEDGKSHADYHNASYVPRFLDTVDNETLTKAYKACNGSNNVECVFDYAFTLNIDVAENTKTKRQDVDAARKEIVMSMPTVNTCSTVNVTVGQNVSCSLKLEAGLNLEIIGNSKSMVVYNKETTTLYFRQTNQIPHDIWFVAVNTDGRKSLQETVPTILCTGCSGRGYCTGKTRSDPREKAYFKYSECVCFRGYSGVDCENVFDGCADRPCSRGRNCTRLSAVEQVNQNRTYICSPCPGGFENDPDTDDCQDINECNTSKPCDQTCLNREGSFACDCHEGFRLDLTNTSKCADINECNEATHNCTQFCENTIGGFRCKCQAGYVFNQSEWSCQIDNIDPCANATIDCNNTSGCVLDKSNQTTCFCDAGYSFNRTTLRCQDTNECEQNICPQECTNTVGSFKCSCLSGFQLVDSVSCEPCVVPYWGRNCEQMCNCVGRGAAQCNPTRGCECLSGWTGSTCDDDIDECLGNLGICADVRKTCHNTIGSFNCECIPGYRENSDGFCRDIDECLDPVLNVCPKTCRNTDGSYTCGCESGYTRLNSTHCRDIDECEVGVAECEQMCENHPGFYNCYCYFGYRLNDDRRTCRKVEDVCKGFSNLTCAGYCIVEDEKASCKCNSGFELGNDALSCHDINECLNSTLNKCSSGATCTNTHGSFLCECSIGMKLQNDKRSCAVCDNYHFGKDCSQSCSCIHGVCNNKVGCVCDSGWSGVSCDVDIDECTNNLMTCKEPHTRCLNTPGNATCVCREGYRRNSTSGLCEDVNECIDTVLNTCGQICTNTQGSFVCSCRDGFLLEQGQCLDINECKAVHGCEQQCDNTIGSYRCSCKPGFVLDLFDRKSCISAEICNTEQKATCSANASCSISDGSVVCVCPKGYNGPVCTDIDECKTGQHRCNQICNNTVGSYLCQCKPGYFLQDDNTGCQVCNDGTYGEKCATKCICNVTNTNLCNRTTGSCTCKKGWTGIFCNEDIDECNTTANSCPARSTCDNKPGGYTCDCNAGYIKNAFGQCQECQQGRFGTDCNESCLCDMAHTSECKTNNGSCICEPGWTGKTCNEDVKECNNEATCSSNSTCIEANGSFECICNRGFKRSLLGSKCLACSDNTYGDRCSLTCPCKADNTKTPTQSCDRVNGSCLCTAFWKGITCEEDIDECKADVCPDSNAFCHNTLLGYKCFCKKGFVLHETRKLCENVTKLSEEHKALKLQITLNIAGNDINLSIESTFAVYAEKVVSSLRKYWSRFIKDFTVVVNTLRTGSLHVDYTLYYVPSTNTSKAVSNALVEMVNGVELEFDGKTVSTVSVGLANSSVVCDVYQVAMGDCGFGMACVVEKGIAKCAQNPMASPDSIRLIVGVTVSLGLLLLLGIIIAVYALNKRKARTAMKIKQKEAYNNRAFQHGDQRVLKFQVVEGRRNYGAADASRYRTWRSLALGFSGTYPNEHDRSATSFKLPRLAQKQKRTNSFN
ncbi:neurogenic locus notch homolog protein 1-like [Dreissena polymorpha]|uniref:neurogenic locus notch homolog protein 1-like n=1 Tax=Dreissena polymorpha TaxID=45954 RepID=UPI002264F29D|nr:neurogenic locus notch homolog protein 1-like [Dreissena polymorpha]